MTVNLRVRFQFWKPAKVRITLILQSSRELIQLKLLNNPHWEVVYIVNAIYAEKKKCILKYKESKNLLDTRNEFISEYAHKNKYKLWLLGCLFVCLFVWLVGWLDFMAYQPLYVISR